jgi:hypothetical protein
LFDRLEAIGKENKDEVLEWMLSVSCFTLSECTILSISTRSFFIVRLSMVLKERVRLHQGSGIKFPFFFPNPLANAEIIGHVKKKFLQVVFKAQQRKFKVTFKFKVELNSKYYSKQSQSLATSPLWFFVFYCIVFFVAFYQLCPVCKLLYNLV